MTSRIRRRTYSFVFATLLVGGAAPAAAADPAIKVAFWNVRSGKGIVGLPGHAATFADTTNCTDPTRPLNAWGVGLMQAELIKAAGDPSVVALGVNEAWSSLCASPENIRKVLGWKSASREQNGVAVLARYGFAGPDQWLQLDTTLNTNPADTMWVVRAPVCLDAVCSQSMPVYVAHWYAMGDASATSYNRQAQQTTAFLTATAGGQPHVFVGDLNVWEGPAPICSQIPNNTALASLRGAGYMDAWLTVHGATEGYTGMVNRAGCGYPEGYPFKRIDYAWTPAFFQPIDIRRFGIAPPGDPAASDHFGVVVTLPHPGTPAPAPSPAPAGSGNIVLHAKNATIVGSSWAVVADGSAAGGARLSNPDAGAAKLASAVATPASYFELPFTAEPGRAYHLWIRGRAQGDSWQNDSTFVQFTGSRDAGGAAIFRSGSTSATIVSIEESSGAGLSGWGWQDNGYGALGPAIYFDAAAQKVRIQVREDGLSIDQIVLSPVQYATAAPGAGKNDATVLAESSPAAPPPAITSISWTSMVNASASGATIQKISGCGQCSDAGGISVPSNASGPSASFTVNAGHRLVVGLGRDTGTNTSYAGIDYGFSFGGGAAWEIREAGVYRTEGAFAPSDVFRIAVEGAAVKYYRNGQLVYTSKMPIAGPLVVDTSLQSIGAAVTLR